MWFFFLLSFLLAFPFTYFPLSILLHPTTNVGQRKREREEKIAFIDLTNSGESRTHACAMCVLLCAHLHTKIGAAFTSRGKEEEEEEEEEEVGCLIRDRRWGMNLAAQVVVHSCTCTVTLPATTYRVCTYWSSLRKDMQRRRRKGGTRKIYCNTYYGLLRTYSQL